MDRISPFSWIAAKIVEIGREYYLTEYFIPLALGVIIALLSHNKLYLHIVLLFLLTSILFIVIIFKRVENESKESTYNLPKNFKYQGLIAKSNEFFCTSLIPTVLTNFSTWFEAEMIDSFSVIISRRSRVRTYKACRVLLFEKEKQLNFLRAYAFFDGSYARRVAVIHKNSGVDLAYLPFDKFKEICAENLNNVYFSLAKQNCINKIRCDFAVFRFASNSEILAAVSIKRKSFINPIRSVSYEALNNPEKEEYKQMMDKLKNTLYSGNRLKPDCDFYKFLLNG